VTRPQFDGLRMEESYDRVGVLVVRVWTERDGQIRARITSSTDVLRAESQVRASGTVEDISAVIQEWLERFARGAT
jgi:hypothetical protein